MLLLDDLHFVVLERQFEHGHDAFSHELDRDWTDAHAGKLLPRISNVLSGLYDAYLVLAAFCLDRNDTR